MLAAVSIFKVPGSRVSNAAVMSPCSHLPCRSRLEAKDVADRVEEHAVSILIAGPVSTAQFKGNIRLFQ